jgi:hypothetical protein
MKKVLLPLLALVLVLGLAVPALAAGTVYTDKSAWEAEVGTYETEDFSDATLNPGVSVVTDQGYVTGGLWWDQVDDGDWPLNTGGEIWTTTWTFDDPIYAWGGTFDAYDPGGPGSSIKVTYIDGTSIFVGTIPNTINDAFWGFVSDEPFIQVHLEDAALIVEACETYAMNDMVYSWSPEVTVDKVWTMTNVCFEVDNDRDGQLSEDWVDGEDNDGDGSIDEDPHECCASTTGTVIDELEALVKGTKIHTVTPGQVYAMSTVTIGVPVDELEIVENFHFCTVDMLELNPKKGGGQVIVVYWNEAESAWEQIYDANDPEVVVDAVNGLATVTLTDVDAGTYLVLVKFSAKKLKGEDFDDQSCTNANWGLATIGGYSEGDSATATLTVVERVPE